MSISGSSPHKKTKIKSKNQIKSFSNDNPNENERKIVNFIWKKVAKKLPKNRNFSYCFIGF